jgi:hypothetical protein
MTLKLSSDERYAQLLARAQAERNRQPLTLRLTETADPRNPYIVAKTLAVQGLAVFPVRGKQPLTDDGVYSATCDLNVLCRMNWRDADGCGLATGEINDLDVLDVDVRPTPLGDRERFFVALDGVSGFATLATLGPLPETLAASTPNGGNHYWFRHIIGSRSLTSRSLGAGLEWFSDKKLVVVPPAPGRTWLDVAEVAQAPDWLKAQVLAASQHNRDDDRDYPSGPLVTKPDLQSQVPDNTPREVPRDIYFLIVSGMPTAKPRVQRRVRGLWANLADKRDHRNDGLNYTAWQFSQFIETGDLKVEIAGKLLWLACEANGYLKKDGPDVVKEVITRVLAGGDAA